MHRKHPALFASAYEDGIHDPTGIIEFHRRTFGSLRMEDGDGDTEPTGADPQGGSGGDGGPGQGVDRGFPTDTPVAEMTAEQQTAYWRDKAQKHERAWRGVIDKNLTPEQVIEMQERLAEHERAALSDQERAIADARSEGRAEALAESGEKYARVLLDAQLAGRGKSDAERAALIEGANLRAFTTDTGEVAIDKITTYVDALAPAGAHRRTPDTGQGHRSGAGTALGATGVAAGAEMYAASRGKTTT